MFFPPDRRPRPGPGLEFDPTSHGCTCLGPYRERNKWGREGPSPPGGLPGQNGPHQVPPSSRRTCPLAAPVPHYLLAHRRGRHLGEFWLSPDAPTTPIRQKARFKIRDAKCHLRPRSQERAKDTLRHPLLGKWITLPCLLRERRRSPQSCWVGLPSISSCLSVLHQGP